MSRKSTLERIKLTREEFERLARDEDISYRYMREHYGLTQPSVRLLVKKYSLEWNPPQGRGNLKIKGARLEKLKELAADPYISQPAAARQLGVCIGTLQRTCKRESIVWRSHLAGARNKARLDVIRHLYEEHMFSTVDIGRLYDLSHQRVHQILRNNGIPTRTHAEACEAAREHINQPVLV